MIETLGQLVFLYITLKLAYWCFQLLRAFGPHVKPVQFSAFGSWTIVTGGTDGIGREYARQLAQQGQNIIIVGRNTTKLAEIKAEIESRGRACRTIQADLSRQVEIDRAAKSVGKLCDELDVGMLINNAGVSYPHMDYYHDVSSDMLDCLVNVNCSALMMITQAFIKQRVNKKKGIVVNISSTFGLIPAPFCSLYGATKAFVRHFSKSVRYEYRYTNEPFYEHIFTHL